MRVKSSLTKRTRRGCGRKERLGGLQFADDDKIFGLELGVGLELFEDGHHPRIPAANQHVFREFVEQQAFQETASSFDALGHHRRDRAG